MEPRKPCHNCRRNRRRCDRSVPSCNKCHSLGQDCLGYGQLFRWTNSVTSRGRLKGRTTFPKSQVVNTQLNKQWSGTDSSTWTLSKPLITSSLVDPVFQDLDAQSKFYLHYYSSRVSMELVAHDYVGINPFRDLVPMSSRYTFLRPIVIAVSALHYSNLVRRAAPGDKEESPASISALIHALDARHAAIRTLQALLEHWQHEKSQGAPKVSQRSGPEVDAFLATIVFFINFALIDSSGGGWQAHLGAAGRLLIPQAPNFAVDESSQALTKQARPATGFEACLAALFSDLSTEKASLVSTPALWHSHQLTVRDFVASDAVAYYVWNSTLASLIRPPSFPEGRNPSPDQAENSWELDPESLLPILLRTETNCYHSCPAALLCLMLRTSRLVRRFRNSPNPAQHASQDERLSVFTELLQEAQSFDVEQWAADMSARNAANLVSQIPPEIEMALRVHVGAVYRATACLYILLAAPGLYRYVEHRRSYSDNPQALPTLPLTSELAELIHHHLSKFEPDSPFFKYTTWPVFMTGVEAGPSGERRAWVIARLQRMYDLCPWGMLKSAEDVLLQIWAARDRAAVPMAEKMEAAEVDGGELLVGGAERRSDRQVLLADDDEHDWLSRLRGLKIDCLIV
ncbi:fungal-specific transcription factor domain-containing protein [Microdochium trichocladiopsis]|uniref:Fungal-specific transcription factor domain-containing protein n=1 Tax=Microdochium trichocladiopsis TaxID=1682393 RepID=A0A9P8Y042_9PEZI|nr:fungal-specific transcription factor domain-containing protein [Microdochium trichocladiopsis]KAH7026283.1 fungal-specific transcription factor domain-containing protein [Microdochium trichocladiopsis]